MIFLISPPIIYLSAKVQTTHRLLSFSLLYVFLLSCPLLCSGSFLLRDCYESPFTFNMPTNHSTRILYRRPDPFWYLFDHIRSQSPSRPSRN